MMETIDIQVVKEISFALFGMLAILGAGYILFTKNLLYAAYSLLLSLIGVAGIFVFAGADFVAVSQIMVYVGGILVLLVFAIMLTQSKNESNEATNKIQSQPIRLYVGIGLGLVLFFSLAKMVFDVHIEQNDVILPQSTIKKIGIQLVTENLVVFELVGLLLLVALIGAAHIAKNDDK